MRTAYFVDIDILQYQNLIRKLCWDFIKPTNRTQDFEDLYQECILFVLEKKSKFNPTRGKLSTFVHHIVVHHLCDIFRRNKREPQTELIENLTDSELMTEDTEEIGYALLSHDAQNLLNLVQTGKIALSPQGSIGRIKKTLIPLWGEEKVKNVLTELQTWFLSM